MKKNFQLANLFDSYAQFCQAAPGADTSADFDSLQGSAVTSRKRIVAIIGAKTFDDIVALNSDADWLKDILRSAVANLTLATQIVFDTVNRRKADINVYKYEYEAMKRSYMENFYNAMDSLISELSEYVGDDDNENILAPYKDWQKTNYYKLLASCKVDNADDFDAIYPIDLSYLFFFRCIPLQKEVLDEGMGAYFDRLEHGDGGSANLETAEKVLPMLRLALVKKTVAKALRRFDILEFPVTIRNLFEDNTASRSGSDEASRAINLAVQLEGEVEDLLHNIDLLMDADQGNDYLSFSAHNDPNDSMYLMP